MIALKALGRLEDIYDRKPPDDAPEKDELSWCDEVDGALDAIIPARYMIDHEQRAPRESNRHCGGGFGGMLREPEISKHDHRAMLRAASFVAFTPGEVATRQGASADALLFVLSGRFTLRQRDDGGELVSSHALSPSSVCDDPEGGSTAAADADDADNMDDEGGGGAALHGGRAAAADDDDADDDPELRQRRRRERRRHGRCLVELTTGDTIGATTLMSSGGARAPPPHTCTAIAANCPRTDAPPRALHVPAVVARAALGARALPALARKVH